MNKTCAIVGVGEGLGMAIARRFHRENYQLALMSRSLDKLKNYEQSLKDSSSAVNSFSADVANSQSLTEAFQQVKNTLGSPEVLIYNAAMLRTTDLMSVTAEDLLQDYGVNVIGALISVQQVIENMRQQQRGTILFTGGGYAIAPEPQMASLSMGKAALRNLTFSLAKQLQPDGIRVATCKNRQCYRLG
jgi:short-subunit dehydrogenase